MKDGEPTTAPPLRVLALESVPHPSCAVCVAAARRRECGHEAGSAVTVRECNAIIRQHPHRAGGT
ncbi:hypothetical protein [Streptomyces sp. x-80]|jgi:hypothetical protein|uniref:hypothetical protein n=1 Tax=Streptomyces sp. x-80 TaxID=2789282 RepID=UPI003980FBE8